MREVKFRGKGIDTDDWIYGSLMYSPKEIYQEVLEDEKSNQRKGWAKDR